MDALAFIIFILMMMVGLALPIMLLIFLIQLLRTPKTAEGLEARQKKVRRLGKAILACVAFLIVAGISCTSMMSSIQMH